MDVRARRRRECCLHTRACAAPSARMRAAARICRRTGACARGLRARARACARMRRDRGFPRGPAHPRPHARRTQSACYRSL
jgi:hypothetical protein